jgi:catechol 2,3-dioxygenase-like lactoylglutathione lyase family enzyme
MPTLDTYRKQAKLLVRWHREGNHSVAGRIRILPRHALLTDHEVLAQPFTLGEAQEIIARETGHENWAALRATCGDAGPGPRSTASQPRLAAAVPVLFVADVGRSAAFYRDRLGFTIDFLHGQPPFYGSVSRDSASLHLKWVHAPVFGAGRVEAEKLIMAFLPVTNVKALYAEFVAADVAIVEKLTKQAWGGTDFHVRDPDRNVIAFVG